MQIKNTSKVDVRPNGITLGQTITDPNNQIYLYTKYAIERHLGQFDPINQMIPLTVIPLSCAHCSKL